MLVVGSRSFLTENGAADDGDIAQVMRDAGHTLVGVAANGRLLGWIGLACWWVTVLAGLTVLLRWLPGHGRHAGGPVGDSWGEGPGLSLLAHVGMLLGVLIFTIYLAVGELPPS